jgi:hypothetical protein
MRQPGRSDTNRIVVRNLPAEARNISTSGGLRQNA